MSTTTRQIAAPPHRVFEVLANGWFYSAWVVGASVVRAVSPDWPQQGAKLHHAVGLWPILIKDHTEVLECELDKRLVLKARGWPAGEARVELIIEPDGDGRSLVTLVETPTGGPGQLLRNPVGDQFLHQRNRECLRRLAALAEQHQEPTF